MATVRFQLRRDTSTNWASVNPTLNPGEPALETDTRRQKIGDGATAWNSLAYVPDGTVKSVNVSGGSTGLSFTGGPITGSGTLTLGGTLAVANGGTGAATSTGSGSVVLATAPTLTNSARIKTASTGSEAILSFDAGDIGLSVRDSQIRAGNNGSNQTYLDFYTANGSTPVAKWRVEPHGPFRPITDNSFSIGTASFRASVIFAGTGAINTSDRRNKQNIGAVPDEWLDAWGEVQWCRFRFRDAARAKGEDARWHIGLVAQQVHEAFAAHGLDAFEIGLLCFDEWDEQREPIISKTGTTTNRTRVTVKAGNRWGLRYDECFAVEAACQRRRMDRLEALISAKS